MVITSSLAHRTGRIYWDDIDAKRFYLSLTRYQQSKLANLLHMFELDRRLRDRGSRTIALACHPGVAVTDLGRNYALFPYLAPFLRFVFNTREAGAWPTLQAATAPDGAGGDYYGPSTWGEDKRTGRQGLGGGDEPRSGTREAALGAVRRDDRRGSGNLARLPQLSAKTRISC